MPASVIIVTTTTAMIIFGAASAYVYTGTYTRREIGRFCRVRVREARKDDPARANARTTKVNYGRLDMNNNNNNKQNKQGRHLTSDRCGLNSSGEPKLF